MFQNNKKPICITSNSFVGRRNVSAGDYYRSQAHCFQSTACYAVALVVDTNRRQQDALTNRDKVSIPALHRRHQHRQR